MTKLILPAMQLSILAPSLPAEARDLKRDPHVRAQWMLTHPCPSTGKTRGRCDGWEIDHAESLCAGGKDEPANLQWLEKEQHRLKTLMDIKRCAIIRREKKQTP